MQLEQDESNLYIFVELVTKGSLLSLYQRFHLRDTQVSAYTRQIFHVLKYLHDRHVVHRDIKCANIMVHANGSLKLADFGLRKAAVCSFQASNLNDLDSLQRTASLMAPELLNQKKQGYGLPADIWSIGCTVLEMLTRRIPYSDLEYDRQGRACLPRFLIPYQRMHEISSCNASKLIRKIVPLLLVCWTIDLCSGIYQHDPLCLCISSSSPEMPLEEIKRR
ncbi:Mitogen-activated protein kinase kinase kinase 1 [Linum grandiflorum]